MYSTRGCCEFVSGWGDWRRLCFIGFGSASPWQAGSGLEKSALPAVVRHDNHGSPGRRLAPIHLPRQLIIRRRTGNQARIHGMEDSGSPKCPPASHPVEPNLKHPRLMDGTMAVCYCCFLLERGRSCTVIYNYNTVIQGWWPVDAGWRFLDAFSCMCPIHTLHSTATARSSCADVRMFMCMW